MSREARDDYSDHCPETSVVLGLRAVHGALPPGALRATKSAIHADLSWPWVALCRESTRTCEAATWSWKRKSYGLTAVLQKKNPDATDVTSGFLN